MRATGQIRALRGPMEEAERRMVAARAILGEWLGGSGGGWQDSGGLWPGIKLIEGVTAQPGDAEYGLSRGCLLPRHTLLGPDRVPPAARARLQESLVLVHGGMAQNVGPILEMVTEKYLAARRGRMGRAPPGRGHLGRNPRPSWPPARCAPSAAPSPPISSDRCRRSSRGSATSTPSA